MLSEHSKLLSSWERGAFSSGDRPEVLCYSNYLATPTESGDNQSRLRQQLLRGCKEYALNYLPTHLLRINDMTLFSRQEVWEAERVRVENELQQYDPNKLARSRLGGRHKLQIRVNGITDINQIEYICSLFEFAIFSHRWGDDEPVFGDILDKRLSKKPTTGYKKLLKFCERATDYDCRYAWSDTCCINKESSVELDEAIRSMYRWYSIAAVCVVHLAKSSTVEDLQSEPWFMRGWTLQELLAPRVMRFFGENWEPIFLKMSPGAKANDKAIPDVRRAIRAVTRIPDNDLWQFEPLCDRVVEKMSWASRRETTKVEDTAYSLLGLFSVSLPIAYGEADRAWYRLMSVIADECTDTSFFAWAGPPSPYSRVFPSSPASYSRHDPRIPARFFNHPHPYKVTKLGVEVDTLMVPAQCDVLRDDNRRCIGYVVRPDHLRSFLVGAEVLWGNIKEYRLGIINFHSSRDVPLVKADDQCHCLLLARKHSDEQRWTVLNTDFVVVVPCLEDIPVYKRPETVLLYHK